MMIALPKVVLLSLIVQCKNKASFKTYKTITKQNKTKTKSLEKKQYPNTETGKTIQCKKKQSTKTEKLQKMHALTNKQQHTNVCIFLFFDFVILLFLVFLLLCYT